MDLLERATGPRGLRLALGAAAIGGLVHGTLLWAASGLIIPIAVTLANMGLLFIAGITSARRSFAAAVGLILAMWFVFSAVRWAIVFCLDGESMQISTAVVLDTLAVAAAAAAGCILGRERGG